MTDKTTKNYHDKKPTSTLLEMAQMLGLSASRFCELLNDGIFTSPLHCPRTREAFFNENLQLICLKVWITKVGMDGERISQFSKKEQSEKEKILERKSICPPFEEARKIARSLGFKTLNEYRRYCKSEKHDPRLPKSPYNTYADKWKGWRDWLGTTEFSSSQRAKRKSIFPPFEEARKIARSLGFRYVREYGKYCKSEGYNPKLPKSPHYAYADKWKGWRDWLGTTELPEFLPFHKAREMVRQAKLKNFDAWLRYCSFDKPDNIPARPNKHYPEFVDWEDWLGI